QLCPAELLVRGVDPALHARFVAHVYAKRQRLASARRDLLGGRVDRAGKFWVRLGGLRRDRDVGAVARGPQRDRESDAARRAGDEQGFSRKARHGRDPQPASAGSAELMLSAPSTTACSSARLATATCSAKNRASPTRAA